MINQIPKHLKKYVVEQNLENYTPRDHAVWRFSMRQLKSYLLENAHPSYAEGLEKTGIQVESIPRIKDIDQKLRKFGWSAIPVSGFIPPGAFMEFQSLSFLPIASGIRSLDHILYTPAPDIIHEAAGHAPIIADPKFAQYLKNYAEVANKAIINKEDINLYKAIRELSDIKEHHESTSEQIQKCEDKLNTVSQQMGSPSEASLLGRMNWWTAEYGLVGTLDNPKIFGAGLLSSVGESEKCLSDNVKKIPLTVDCIDYSYDITEQQPQLFVASDFAHLTKVLNDLSEKMAYKIGGNESVQKAIFSRTINTIELNSGLQISGKIAEQVVSAQKTIFLKLAGAVQLCVDNSQLVKQGTEQHPEGYSTIVDTIGEQCLSTMNKEELKKLGLEIESSCQLNFDSGFKVNGQVKELIFENNKLVLVKFISCHVTYQGKSYFEPEWGDFDLGVGCEVISVFGGPADSLSYIEIYDYPAKRIPEVKHSEKDKNAFVLYQKIRDIRTTNKINLDQLQSLTTSYINEFADQWLIGIELLELSSKIEDSEEVQNTILLQLENAKVMNSDVSICIDKGIELYKL